MNVQLMVGTAAKTVSTQFSKVGVVAGRFAPQILVGVGIVSGVAAGVSASLATRKLDSILVESNDLLEKVKAKKSELAERDFYKQIGAAYGVRVRALLELYGPAIALGLISVSSILASHGILESRNVALAGAYKVVSDGFKKYRGRVIADHGAMTDYAYMHDMDVKVSKETTVNEDGTETKVKKAVLVQREGTDGLSMYSRIFSRETSSQWSPNKTFNYYTIRSQQDFVNELLKAKGHIFLNEVYDALGLKRTKEGALVGWVYDPERDTDNYIDFGVFNPETQVVEDFVVKPNGDILLDFNVDGVIWNLL